ncbi:MAG: sulfatase [Candidatus Latescibacterota bacterium]|nr:sulfatase [Candidatus Latescibacterota bacterium]
MATTRPNVVFVFADQMRGCDLGCAGNPDVHSPNLDRLSAEGVYFEHATSCIPVCTPARACLLTARYPLSTGMFLNDLQLSTRERTIAHALSDDGYHTIYVGKWHLDGGNRFGFTPPGERRHGFQRWHALNCDHRDYFNPLYYEDSPTPIRPRRYCTDHETDRSIQLMAEHLESGADTPFALFLSWSPPHNPYHQVPERWCDRYDPLRLNLPANTPDLEQTRHDLAGYYAHISALDECVGKLTNWLESRDLFENTIFVFTSDHGDMHGAHGVQRKQWPWEESVRVPLIVHWPREFPPQRCQVLCNTVDIAPTLMSWIGCSPLAAADGSDLSSAIAGCEPGPTSVFLQVIAPFGEQRSTAWRAVRTRSHLYARNCEGPWLLYDLEADPDQRNNIVNNGASGAIQAGLERELKMWLEQTEDPFLEPQSYLDRYGYQVEECSGASVYTYDLDAPVAMVTARRREDLGAS